MRAGEGVIATIAGDIHNYQRIQPADHPGDQLDIGKTWTSGLPPVQIVAGGAGAYLSATHVIDKRRGLTPVKPPVAEKPERTRSRYQSDDGTWTVTRPCEYPSREESVVHYFTNLRGPRYYTLLVLLLVAAGLLTAWATAATTAPYAGHDVLVHALVVVIPILWAVVLYFLARRGRVVRGAVYLGIAAGLLALALFCLDRKINWEWVGTVALGVFVMAATLAAMLGPALIRALPGLRRAWPVRLVALGLLVALQQGTATEPVRFVVYVAAGYGALRGARRLLKAAKEELQRQEIYRSRWFRRPVFAVLRSLPTASTVGGMFLAAAVFPAPVLDAFGLSRDLAGLVRHDTLSVNVLALLLFPVAGLGWPLVKQRRTVPRWLLPTSVLAGGALGGSVGVAVAFWSDAGPWSPFSAALTSLIIGSLLVAALCLLAGSRSKVAADKEIDPRVADALARRDGADLPRCDLPTAARMVVSSIPSVDSLAEATKPPFHKNILVLDVQQEPSTKDREPVTVVTLTAKFLDDESRSGAANTGFLDLEDKVTLRYHPNGLPASPDLPPRRAWPGDPPQVEADG
jgi:hypothetical protein